MRALVYRNNTLTLERRYQEPSLEPGEALVKVLQVGICNTDLEITRGYMAFEGVLAREVVGVVESVHDGSGATAPSHWIGKRVVGEITAACRRADCFYCRR